MVGDAAVAAFFWAEKAKQREQKRCEMRALVATDLKKQGFISLDSEVDGRSKSCAKVQRGSCVSLGTGVP